jgi:hypothetical protein
LLILLGLRIVFLIFTKLVPTLISQYNARVAQLVERQPSKLNVAGSNPVSRSLFIYRRCSSGVERFLGKEEVTSSNLVIGSSENKEIP